jgi:DNA-binding response OmpR family regulator
MRVLLVENDAEVAQTLAAGLRRHRIAVDTAPDGRHARARAALASYPARRIATRAGARLALSPKEFAVLELLLAADGAVVSVDETVPGYGYRV